MPTTSAGVCATSPRGTGTPYRPRMAFAWYSWIFTSFVPVESCRPADLPC